MLKQERRRKKEKGFSYLEQKSESFSYRRERRKKQSSARVSAIKNVLKVGRGCYNFWGLTEECEISRTLVGGETLHFCY
ncbi:hypothetical protein QUB47_30895 [Microcoleus sp. AT9_B5]